MSETQLFIQGEAYCTIDKRSRLTLPTEFAEFKPKSDNCVIVKERPGCLSLWEEDGWKSRQDARVKLIQAKMATPGLMEQRAAELQRFGRLLSVHHSLVKLQSNNRVTLPEEFRKFLAVEPEGEVVVIGAILCIEIWHPAKWINYVEGDIQEFDNLFNLLAN